jgi:carbon monoxide dehydrogenase subunit G
LKLTNEFTVAAPPERTWATLLDLRRVAGALPGASLAPGADGAFTGTMKVRFGPVVTEYAGTARLQDVDEDERVASFWVEGRERGGQGSASATITSRVSPGDAGSRVVVETELQVTGRQAQLGRKLMEDVASGVLARFAEGLEAEIAGTAAPAPAGRGDADVLDVGGAALDVVRERAVPAAIAAVAGLLLGYLLWGRRR